MQDGTIEPQTTDVTTAGENSTATNWEEQYKKLQADYTRKSQEIAELKKAKSADGLSEEERQLLERNKSQGFVTKDDLNELKEEAQRAKEIAQNTEFRNLLRISPELAKHEEAIRSLQKAEGLSYEEIALKYKFTSSDKLEKAKASNGSMVGAGVEQVKEKPVSEMTSEEYVEYKKKLGITGKNERVAKSV